MALRGPAARVMNHEGLRRRQIALRRQLALRGSSTRVINHEGKWLCEGLRRG
jgi:hypothetical protein